MSQRYYEKAWLMIMQEIHVILKRCQFIRDRNKMRKIHHKNGCLELLLTGQSKTKTLSWFFMENSVISYKYNNRVKTITGNSLFVFICAYVVCPQYTSHHVRRKEEWKTKILR